MTLIGKVLVAIGVISLVHAGYSAVQYRTYLKLTEEEFSGLPIDVTVQVILAVLMSIAGIVKVVDDLSDIHAAAELADKTWETFGNRSSFYNFNHRGKLIHGNQDQE